MKIAFCITKDMSRRCFTPADLDRLSGHDVQLPFAVTEAEIRERWRQVARGAEVLVTGWHSPVITDAMLDESKNVKLIAHAAGSIRHLLPASVFERGIRVSTANSALAVGVAETTLGMIISGLKAFDRCAQLTRAGGWKINDNETPNFAIRELFGMTIGLVGLGQAGRHLARLLSAFEVEVLACDPYASVLDGNALDVTRVELPELMSRSDVVSLHVPALPETRHMISGDSLAAMKDGAILINTSRGSIIDEQALIAELRTGRISAILDVTDPEPPVSDHPFRSMPNVVLTPHIAGAIANGCLRQGRCTVGQILAYAKGQKIHGEVTEQSLVNMA